MQSRSDRRCILSVGTDQNLCFIQYEWGGCMEIFFRAEEGKILWKVEDMFREMIAGPGAVRATIHKYVG